jgi:phosphoenolpyruvate synthase/pyruvate phosphate dikinase
MKKTILSLSDSLAALDNAGANGMSLAKMIGVESPVPNGFHVTTDASCAFVDANNLPAKIPAALKD